MCVWFFYCDKFCLWFVCVSACKKHVGSQDPQRSIIKWCTNTVFKFRVQAEARAEFAERSVQKLQKEVDRLEGEFVGVQSRDWPPSPLSSIYTHFVHPTARLPFFFVETKIPPDVFHCVWSLLNWFRVFFLFFFLWFLRVLPYVQPIQPNPNSLRKCVLTQMRLVCVWSTLTHKRYNNYNQNRINIRRHYQRAREEQTAPGGDGDDPAWYSEHVNTAKLASHFHTTRKKHTHTHTLRDRRDTPTERTRSHNTLTESFVSAGALGQPRDACRNADATTEICDCELILLPPHPTTRTTHTHTQNETTHDHNLRWYQLRCLRHR